MAIKKYFPIKIFHVMYGYGWWFGDMLYFFGKYMARLIIVPVSAEIGKIEYASNQKAIEHGDSASWSISRQKEKQL